MTADPIDEDEGTFDEREQATDPGLLDVLPDAGPFSVGATADALALLPEEPEDEPGRS